MSNEEAVPGSTARRMTWQGITAICLGALLAVTAGLLAWSVSVNVAHASTEKRAQSDISRLKNDLARAKTDAESATAVASDLRGNLSDSETKVRACKSALSLYAEALADVAKAAQAGLNTATATVYLADARTAQSAANATGCVDVG